MKRQSDPVYFDQISSLKGRRELRETRAFMIRMLVRQGMKLPEPYLKFYNSAMYRQRYHRIIRH